MNEKEINITFGIKEIKTLKFNIENFIEPNQLDKEKLQFQVFSATTLEYESRIMSFDLIIILFSDNSFSKKLCELVTKFSYDIKNLHELVPPEEKNSPKFPEVFMQTLLSISLSTSRGILFAKTEGSSFGDIYLPVLNPTEFKTIETKK